MQCLKHAPYKLVFVVSGWGSIPHNPARLLLTGQPLGPPLIGHTGRVTSVAFSADGKTLASASDDETIRLWDAARGQPRGLTVPVGERITRKPADSDPRVQSAGPLHPGAPAGAGVENPYSR
jgi:WD40 repeat protein